MSNFWLAEWNGNEYLLKSLNEETKTISETSPFTPEGAYTTFRTYDRTRVLRLTKHLDRLEETSRLAGFEIRLERESLKKTIVQCMDDFGEGELRIRLTIDLTKQVGAIYIAMETLHVPDPDLYVTGIETATAEMHRNNPKAKLSNFLSRAASAKAQFERSYEEILMYDDKGDFLEGLSSNFYAVKDGKVYTAEEGVLSGTTRDFVLKIAKECGIEVVLNPVNLKDVPVLEEAFITSTSRSILPIRKINDQEDSPVPGPVTAKLMQRFAEELESQKESLI